MSAQAYVPHPDTLEFAQWAARMSESFSVFNVPITLPWKEWGEQFINTTSLNVPRPFGDDWVEWAERVVGVLS